MRGTLIKLLAHALRALSRASKNNWSQNVGTKKKPLTIADQGHRLQQSYLLYVVQNAFTARPNLAVSAVVSPLACFIFTDFSCASNALSID